ncbi:hypothetical protein AQF52_0901 [Streptomyces venezuelae]|uniref:hypothetical protein n=1 Tax=Streptomyces gardneri TaxID=66892 RepID=UPI0006E3CD2E|nr:hypothetical protein [Streptomyces gardneri]ALO06497.1 hypothetical protein AQF52_0901 [Streptomyces venezuelae]QPK43929.1 hypothetical protein H4W23_04410 [Streptomyces gardneri]WRK35195.1 hypothetical protein U0M97_04435 [Streptomyces venezuelae]
MVTTEGRRSPSHPHRRASCKPPPAGPEERRILRNDTNWQPLRRLRSLPAGQLVTHGRAETVRIEIRNAARLLEWLHDGDTTLATCTQDQLDAWLTDGPTPPAPPSADSCSGPADAATADH